MKIMMVVARLNIGGVALNVIQMVSALNQLPDTEVLLVHGQIGEAEGDMAYLAEQAQIPRLELPSLGRELSPLRDLQTIFTLWRLMLKFRPDVVHTHTAKAGWVGRWAAFLSGRKVRVHTFHGHVFSGYFSPRKTQVFLWLERLAAKISTKIITLSQALQNELAHEYHIAAPEKIEVIPLGLDLTPFVNVAHHQGVLRQPLGLAPETPLIGVVGRLVPIKNHALFLEAAQITHQARPDVRFIIIGDGELRAQIEQTIIERKLGEFVFLTGWMQDIPRAYGDLDLVTITSDNEGTPVSLIEAIAAQIPVVSTDVGGVRDLLGADLAAQLVPPQHAEALSAAWLRTLANPPQMETAQGRILAHYDIGGIAAQHAALYRTLLEKK